MPVTFGRFLMGVAALACLAGLAIGQEITDCELRDGLTPICGPYGSEDLDVLPGGHALIVSGSNVGFDARGFMLWSPGALLLLDGDRRELQPLYPSPSAGAGKPIWGDANCPDEIGAALSPHGIHVSERRDGRRQLLVVNHGGRQSVEMFEVLGRGRHTSLAWRGCVLAPENAFLNDVAALPDGFVVTQYMDLRRTMAEQHQSVAAGGNTGAVLRWRRGDGLAPVPGTETPLPNGIQATRDGRTIFVSVKAGHGEVRKYALEDGRLLGAAQVTGPDNLSWTAKGKLLAAGLQQGADMSGCFVVREHPCGAAFEVNEIDPETMLSLRIFAHAGPPLGLATVAVQAGDALYIGSAAGTRVMRVEK